ncbi:MAG TPA: TIGR01777 family oxidoreductase [Acidimicrobiales bacterium]|nr:TIGR01777 family oxidoreductase [Acidimicrobiales bacterium]HLN41968.1 TIGR01777 family oxidoreductase [Acidimicrobiales bacterium]
MRVVISGSSGLIGGSVVTALRSRGDEVTALVRRPPAAGEARWDPDAGSIDTGVLEAADAVVHLAGAGIGDKRWTPARRREIVSSRVQSTSLLARTLAELSRPPSVLVSASAVGFYGDRGDETLTEESAPGDGFLAELCRAWEDATGPATGAAIRVIRLRSGVVLSAHGGALARQLPLFRLGVGGRLGSGRQWLSWISLPDEVGAVLRALDDPAMAGAVNATAPTPVTNRDFTRALGRVLRRPTVMAVPGLALRIALGPDLASEMVLAGQRVLPTKLTAAGYVFDHPDIDTALGALLAPGA